MNEIFSIGLDIGSTTVKIYITNRKNRTVYTEYRRHFSDIKKTVAQILNAAFQKLGETEIKITATGSGGLGISKWLGIAFVQEVVSSTKLIRSDYPEVDVGIELGGEDAKIIYFKGAVEQRMNGSCAGGTGAFIDQMATLLNIDALGLNELAKNYIEIYPIASRCGVFAKTDIQPLINEGAGKSDIAVSIFQAVVNQTVGGLACGKPIEGNVIFLGGPLYYLSELRKRFVETLNIGTDSVILPEDAHMFAARGAAKQSNNLESFTFRSLIEKLRDAKEMTNELVRLEPLFADVSEYDLFLQRHKKNDLVDLEIKEASGNLYIGIDAGSTTTKAVLIDDDNNLLYKYYTNNEGRPLEKIVDSLTQIYEKIPLDSKIRATCVTGYGESLVKAAFKVDFGEIETIAHLKATTVLLPDADFIIDIGGQDMKCLKTKENIIENIMLNEACSSGCGSFLESFAQSLNITKEEFADKALYAKNPVDLGSRCTVFMNSRVKQAQKEGATIGDISAGLSYSLVKNALNKVIKIKKPEDLGEKIVVQGGTFKNDAVLRSFEKIIGRNVIRAQYSELMGAYGAAIIAKEKKEEIKKSNIRTLSELKGFKIYRSNERCGICSNNCLLTINRFDDDSKHISGNRCEKPMKKIGKISTDDLPDLFDYKYKRTFSYYKPLDPKNAKRGKIGIPRILNMYENFPFWHTFFTELGYIVVTSPRSSKKIFEKGIGSIPSESVCYPAKVAHGHVQHLIDMGIKLIFLPCILFEQRENSDADNQYNCPIVTSYPEVLASNIREIIEQKVTFVKLFLPFDDFKKLEQKIFEKMKFLKASRSEVRNAIKKAEREYLIYKNDVRKEGEKALKYIEENNVKGLILAGRPYHVDPGINHGIPQMIKSLGFAVLSEDSVSHLSKIKRNIRVVDQWMYHTRLYAAASFAIKKNDIQMIQLNSFGCGLDAVTTDQVREILEAGNKLYTCIKIDEGNNLGAARIRIRSLLASIKERKDDSEKSVKKDPSFKRMRFTKEMKDYTILAPQMAPIQFSLLEEAFRASGYNFVILPQTDNATVETGLKYVNNDACYPSLIITGQLIDALRSGEYDLNKTALIITQTGGACRATNYIGFIRKALVDAGFENIPVISLSSLGIEKHPGFEITYALIKRGLIAIILGDLLMKLLYRVRPYESIKGSADELYSKWNIKCKGFIKKASYSKLKKIIRSIVLDFEKFSINEEIKKPIIGVVGEILIKYHPMANNNIVRELEKSGVEVVSPNLADFLSYSFYSPIYRSKHLSGKLVASLIGRFLIFYIEHLRKAIKSQLSKSIRFRSPVSIYELAKKAEKLLSLGNQAGEGWFLTAEMIELIESGVGNIVCVQPFACLPNHVSGKGMLKAIRNEFPESNIIAIDYDPGASEVNQLNRIELMLATAFENINIEG